MISKGATGALLRASFGCPSGNACNNNSLVLRFLASADYVTGLLYPVRI